MLYRYTLHIPLTYNDGSRIDPERVAEIIIEIEDSFGGYTRSQSFWDGYWKDEDGKEYRDTIMLLYVDGPQKINSVLEDLGGRYAAHLGQVKIYITCQPIALL